MDKRRVVLAGIVAASMAAGGVLGAIAFTPRVGEAAAGSTTAEATTASTSDDVERPWERCARVAVGFGIRPLAVAADAIGIETAELLQLLHDGETIAEVAEQHGVDPADVVDAIVVEERDRVEEAVANGRLTQGQADGLLASAEERATNLVEGDHAGWSFPGRIGHGVAWPWGPGEGPVAAALEELGVDLPELLDGLREGQTIAEIAEELGVDLDAVVAAIVDAFREHLDRAVDEGRLSEEEADERAAELRERAEAFVNGELGSFPFGPPRLGPGFGHGVGFGPGPGWWSSEDSTTQSL